MNTTNVIGKKVSRETLGPIAERCVIVCVAPKDEQGAAEEHSWVHVPREAALSQNEPGKQQEWQEQM